ncbi:ACT domain protein [uncultured archaeon]|nr:ACT domain protein [uncultured archaeon]
MRVLRGRFKVLRPISLRMKVELRVGVQDRPGALLQALKPISDFGGNILSVSHHRKEGSNVDLDVVLSVADETSLANISRAYSEAKVPVSTISVEGSPYYKRKTLHLLFVGHVIDTDMKDTIDRINRHGLVSDVDVQMPAPEKKSSVLLSVHFDAKRKKVLLEEVQSICVEKKLLLISSIET